MYRVRIRFPFAEPQPPTCTRLAAIPTLLTWIALAHATAAAQTADCVCDGAWNVGETVIRIGAASPEGPPVGALGVIVCGNAAAPGPDTPLLVSWSAWFLGHDGNDLCTCQPPLPNGATSGAFVACGDLLSMSQVTAVSFQQGVGGYSGTVDTSIRASAPGTVLGNSTSLQWDTDDPSGSGMDNFALIRFEGLFGRNPGQVPPGAHIVHATLVYNIFNSGDPASMYDALVDWDESTTFNTFGGSPGVQTTEFALFSDSSPGGSGSNTTVVTASLQKASADPTQHRGWLIVPSSTDGVDLRSSEYTTLAARPKLNVLYSTSPVPTQLLRRPYLLNPTPDSVTIAWRTNTRSDSRVRFGTSPGAPDVTVVDDTLTNHHEITLTGLQSSSTYYYDIGTTTAVLAGGDAEHRFTTLPAPGSESVRVWVLGDSGIGNANQIAVRDAMLAHTAGNPPDFLMHLGDIVYDDGMDSELTARLFLPYRDTLRHLPFRPTFGNHDGHSANSSLEAGAYYESFALPALGEGGGLASGTEAYYSFDHANVHFVCLNAYDVPKNPGAPMLQWLAADLAATQQDWIVAYWHHPPYTKGSHDSDDPADSSGFMIEMRENVLPILEAGGVDLVFCGHSHVYERSFLVDGAYDTPTTAPGHILDAGDGIPTGDGPYRKPLARTPNAGAVYVVAGHGGAAISVQPLEHPLMYVREPLHGSCLLEVTGHVLDVSNVRADGAVSDAFRIIKVAPGDLDGDGDVDQGDLALLLSCYDVPADDCGDSDGDGDTDQADLAALLANYTG